MRVTVFNPGKPPVNFDSADYFGTATGGRITAKFHRVAEQLKCRPSLVDLLAMGHGFALFSVFDALGQPNELAMQEFTRRTGMQLDPKDGVDMILGPVVMLTVE
jgi:hypothetical protein